MSSPINTSPVNTPAVKNDGDPLKKTVQSKPSGEEKSSKKFKNVLDNSEDLEGVTEEATSGDVNEAYHPTGFVGNVLDKPKTYASIFDLTASTVQNQPLPNSKASQSNKEDSNEQFSALNEETLDLPLKSIKQNPALNEETLDSPIKPKQTSLFSGLIEHTHKTNFNNEQPDIASINPLAQNNIPSIDIQISTTTTPAEVKTNLQSLINQMIEKVSEMTLSGKTDTSITLKNPPIFEGANIILTSFDSAKGEFNIAFENLTQTAKNILDLKANKDSLVLALEQKGYTVHIVTTTTLIETRIPTSETNTGTDREAQEQSQKQPQREKRNPQQ